MWCRMHTVLVNADQTLPPVVLEIFQLHISSPSSPLHNPYPIRTAHNAQRAFCMLLVTLVETKLLLNLSIFVVNALDAWFVGPIHGVPPASLLACTQFLTMGRLENRVAIVTASTAGIGLATVRKLAQEGAKVVLSSRNQKNVDEALKTLRDEGLDVAGCVCHVSNADHRQRLVELASSFTGKIDILVCNAAVNPVACPVLDTPEWAIDKIFEVNVKSSLLMVKACSTYFTEHSSVVLVSSILGYQPGANPYVGVYAVSKTALLGLTKALAAELGPRGVRVNAVAPGIIPTKLSAALVESPASRKILADSSALKRLGSVEEIANVVAFLASPEAAYVTGEIVVAAGGTPSRL